VLTRLGASGEALALLEQATVAQPLDAESAVAHAEALARAGRAEDGHSRLLDLLAIRPADAVLLRGRARIEAGIGRLADALAAAGEASAAEPASPENALLMARLLMLGGQHERARRALADVPATQPQRVLLAQEIALRDGATAPLPEFADLLAGLPESSTLEFAQQARQLAGIVLLLAGDAASAQRMLEIATGDFDRLPATVPALTAATLLARAQQLQGRPSPALQVAIEGALAALMQSSAGNPDTLLAAAGNDALRGDHAQALQRIDSAIAAGFRDRWWLQVDPRLAPLRDGAQATAFAARLAQMPPALKDE
jgi:tetratricopeptide (TPR) repeat protein